MVTPRRNIVRPVSSSTAVTSQRQVQRLRARLDRERIALARWQTRLRRAFNSVEKHQRSSARLERKIAHMEKLP